MVIGRKRYDVGSRSERFQLRIKLLAGVAGILCLVALSTRRFDLTSPGGQDAASKLDQELTSELPFTNRILLSTGHEIEECATKHPDLCNTTVGCFVDDELDGACCIPNENATDPSASNSLFCITRDEHTCDYKDLCVAELVPGSAVGAQCLADYEKDYGIVIYLLLLLYLFWAIAIICDDYFTYSLDMLGDLVGMSSDIKGATFAAAGSSAPELFVSLADNVISNPPKSVGVGTIVGSAIFNILIVIGASGIAAGHWHGHLDLDWRPLTRDSVFYVISICALIGVVITDDNATNYEGGILMVLYFFYGLFMAYNEKIFAFVDAKLGIEKKSSTDIKDSTEHEIDTDVKVLDEAERRLSVGSAIGKGQLEEDSDVENEPYFSVLYWPMYKPDDENYKPNIVVRALGGGILMWLSRLYYILAFPMNLLFRLTVPDARYDLFREDKNGVKNHRVIGYTVEFTMSLVHIAICSHFLVWSAEKFGCLVGVSPSVMGLIVLAAGTSVPDTITSIILTRQGEGDAAVANSIGSNVFDILIGLGFPWFLAGFVFGESAVATDDIALSIAFLFGVLIILVIGLFMVNFKLNTSFGVVLCALYVLYVIIELCLK